MADTKLSQITAKVSSLNGTETFYVIVNEGSPEAPVWVEKRLALADVMPFEIPFFIGGEMANNELLYQHIVAVPFYLQATLPGSKGLTLTPASADSSLIIKKNLATIGTIKFLAGNLSPVFTFLSAVSFAVGDVLRVYAPALADGALADVSITLKALRAEP